MRVGVMNRMPVQDTPEPDEDARSTASVRSKNELLRAARERIPSKARPGNAMTRRELATAVNAYVAEHHSTVKGAPLDHRTIGAYENGYYRWPGDHIREAFRELLGVETDVELGFYSWWGRTERKLTDAQGRDHHPATTPLIQVCRPDGDSAPGSAARRRPGEYGVGPDLGPDASGTAVAASLNVRAPIPTRVGWTEVDQVRAATSALAASENLFGGGLACEAAAGQLRWAARLLDARTDDATRRGLTEAVGNLAAVVAFSAFDIGDQPTAARCFRFALSCADEAGSWSLRAATLADMARQAAYVGDLDEALSLIEFAQVRADRLSATGRAMVGTVRARLLAVWGRHVEASDDVKRADEHFSQHDAAADPPWLVYYDDAEHQGSTARALTPHALAEGDPGDAAVRLEAAVRLHSDAYPRSRAFSRTRLATLTMAAGDPRQAAQLGGQALRDAAGLHSGRMAGELGALYRASEQHTSIPDVAELRHRLSTALAGN
jgi:hypothetical protein